MILVTCLNQSLQIPIKVTPKGGQDLILPYTPEDTAIRLKVKAPPEDGKANAAVIALLAKVLDIPKRDVEIIRGETARLKHVRVDCSNHPTEALLMRLAASMQSRPGACFELN